jgi:hypothetical protein
VADRPYVRRGRAVSPPGGPGPGRLHRRPRPAVGPARRWNQPAAGINRGPGRLIAWWWPPNLYGAERSIAAAATARGTPWSLVRGSLAVWSTASMTGLSRYGGTPARCDAVPPPRRSRRVADARCPYSTGWRGSTRPTKLRRMDSTLAKFRVIPGECPLGGSQLMIICPYPFCDASWKRGLGRPVGPCSSDRC